MNILVKGHSRFVSIVSSLESPFLLAIRLYWGWQFMTSGWGKMHAIPRFTTYFASLNIPFPAASAHLVAGVEFFGGILLILGLASRLSALVLSVNLLVAYWTADHEALTSFFSDPDKFTSAAEITFLVAALIILFLGPGLFALDTLLAKRYKEQHS